ncbi:hypothetical protein PTKIN_Ptkin09bG0139400 [Pterospermum kingtungense]
MSTTIICDYDNSDKLSFYYQAEELARVGALAGILMTDWRSSVDGLNIPNLILPIFSCASIRKYAIAAADEAKVKIMRFVLTSFATKPPP